VSRGDGSGTHQRELRIWESGGLRPHEERPAWYVEVGQGMGETLRVASELQAYTLTDVATFQLWRAGVQLDALFGADPVLVNPYSVIVAARARDRAAADRFARWLAAPAAQSLIAAFGVDSSGAPLFEPASAAAAAAR
jgi:tungstate transport system substrate-binding protein